MPGGAGTTGPRTAAHPPGRSGSAGRSRSRSTSGTGAGRTRLALGELSLTTLTVKNSVGETLIDLAGYHGAGFDAAIKNGVGNLVLRLPKDAAITLVLHRGVGSTDVRGLMANGDTYTTAAARPDAPRITFRIKQGVGAVTIEAV